MAAVLPPPPRAPQARPAAPIVSETRTADPLESTVAIAVMAPPVFAPAPEAPTGWFTRFVSKLAEVLADWPNQRCPNCLVGGAALRIEADEVFPLVAPSHRCALCGDLWILPRPDDLG